MFELVTLGHWPRPSIDDPGSVVGPWMWTYDFTAILFLVGLPVAGILAAISLFRPFLKGSPEWEERLIEAVAGALLVLLAFAFLRWDPQRVLEWYLD